jgi:NCAIR mutase (PurE)-related protein
MTTPPLDFATIDFDRARRCGFPEVVFAPGKTVPQLEEIVARLIAAGQDCLVTRVDDEQSARLSALYPGAEHDRVARTFLYRIRPFEPRGKVVVVTAGTGDLPVALEAAVTARALGCHVELIADVGVAGLHRLLNRLAEVRSADVVIVAAGMDGALPSVVGGLVAVPVIAVPTSIGYGASFGGIAALLTMLNACSANVLAVGIDAGFKAGYSAALMARRMTGENPEAATTAGSPPRGP